MSLFLRRQLVVHAWMFALISGAASVPAFAQPPTGGMEARLMQRLDQFPGDASTWRLLGRWRLDHGDAVGALHACEQAVRCDPHSASTHFDLGRVLATLGHFEPAAYHFAEASRLAPNSDYAQEAQTHLQQIAPNAGLAAVAPVSFDEAPNRFGGVPLDEPSVLEPSPFSFRLDAGALYNTNVQLAPLSRTIFAGSTESFQLFAAPEMELRAWQMDAWRFGAALGAYFTINEEEFSAFNVQSYRPGVFVERPFSTAAAEWVSRLQYDFQQDLFDGRNFATRHSVTTSADAIWSEVALSRFYWSVDYSDFNANGGAPSVSSQDGWTHTLGASHEYDPSWGAWELFRGGIDVQMADLRGANFAYNGVFLYGEGEISLLSDVWAVLQLGWGYRDYPDFTLTPARNEHLWRYGVELHKQLVDQWRMTGFLTYDRFDSQNEFYAADRYLTGVMFTYIH